MKGAGNNGMLFFSLECVQLFGNNYLDEMSSLLLLSSYSAMKRPLYKPKRGMHDRSSASFTPVTNTTRRKPVVLFKKSKGLAKKSLININHHHLEQSSQKKKKRDNKSNERKSRNDKKPLVSHCLERRETPKKYSKNTSLTPPPHTDSHNRISITKPVLTLASKSSAAILLFKRQKREKRGEGIKRKGQNRSSTLSYKNFLPSVSRSRSAQRRNIGKGGKRRQWPVTWQVGPKE
jgi:hypothetical protein